MPCGCANPKYSMRFVGWKDGKLIKGAPSLPQGWIQENFIEEATLPHWELVKPVPATKKVPEPTSEESVYEEVIELPPTKEVTTISGADFETIKVVEDIDLMNVRTLKHFIEQRGSEVDPKWLKADLVREARELEEASRAASEASTAEPAEKEPEAKPEPVSEPGTFEATHSNLGEYEVDSASAEEDSEPEASQNGVCKICGTELVCFDREEHGGQKPGCPKCHILDETIMLSSEGEIVFADGTPFKHEDYDLYYRKTYQNSE